MQGLQIKGGAPLSTRAQPLPSGCHTHLHMQASAHGHGMYIAAAGDTRARHLQKMTERLALLLVSSLLFCHHRPGKASDTTEDMVMEVGGSLTSRRGMDATMVAMFGDAPVVHEVRRGVPGLDCQCRRCAHLERLCTLQICSQGRLMTLQVRDLQIPGAGAGSLAARLYRPQSTAHLPIMLYMHGGGWAFGSITSHDTLCKDYANALRAVIVSVEYPLAPEHPFPAALEACYAAAVWVRHLPGVSTHTVHASHSAQPDNESPCPGRCMRMQGS